MHTHHERGGNLKKLGNVEAKHIQEEDDSARPALFHTAHGDPQSIFENEANIVLWCK
jgi:hypothetical protein